jgi:hypothetical protein
MNIASRITGQRFTTPTNIQRNGNLIVSELEQRLIQAAKELYSLRRRVAALEEIEERGRLSTSNELNLETLTRSLGDAWDNFNALETELQQQDLQLSERTLEIIGYAKGNVNHNSLPPKIMMGLFK